MAARDLLEAIVKRTLLAPVYDVAVETPLDEAPILSEAIGHRVWLKREDLQPVFSFKLRGAYAKMASLAPDVRARGVVAASAGNHAQGVALAAQRLGCRALILMPRTTPEIKVTAVRRLGGEVVLFGDLYDDAYAEARRREAEEGLTFVHPYDDPDVVAGQATVGLELMRQAPVPLDAVFVAVGGGGLIAGIGAVVKYLRPSTRVIGVEPVEADAMARSLEAGERIRLDRVGRFADGVAVRQVGELPFALAQHVVDEVVRVDTDAICAAMKDVFEDRRCVLEPSGALAYAGLKAWARQREERGLHLAAIACGANLNFDSLRFVSERAEIGERREAVFAVSIPERPGSFRRFCAILGDRAVTEFNYRYNDPRRADVFVGIRVHDDRERHAVAGALTAEGYDVLDLTDNEVAKLHLRHMVGGHAPHIADERLFSFAFPERPGALAEFLARLHQPWNISLFHYRNHGSDFGRVLCGVQVPESDRAAWASFAAALEFDVSEVTDDPACRRFLGAAGESFGAAGRSLEA